jgi:hypothetical protein
VTFTAPSGATVFAAGTLQFSWALDSYGPAAGHVDGRLQHFALNMLTSLLGGTPGQP